MAKAPTPRTIFNWDAGDWSSFLNDVGVEWRYVDGSVFMDKAMGQRLDNLKRLIVDNLEGAWPWILMQRPAVAVQLARLWMGLDPGTLATERMLRADLVLKFAKWEEEHPPNPEWYRIKGPSWK